MAENKDTKDIKASTVKKTKENTVNAEDMNKVILERLEALEKENKDLKESVQAKVDVVIAEPIQTVKSTSKFKSPLLNKKVKIALIENENNALYKGDTHQGTLLIGASNGFGVPLNQHGTLVNPLTDEEKAYLEDVLDMNLSIHAINTKDNSKANFWTTRKAYITLRKTGHNISTASITLNLNDPYEFILYKISLVSPRVANSWGERFELPGQYEFVIKDGEEEYVEELNRADKEAEVIDYVLKHKNSKKKLFDLVRLYGPESTTKQIKATSDTKFIWSELWKLTKQPNQISKLHEIISLGEKEVGSRVFLADAVTVGMIEKHGEEYRLMGGDLIGREYQEAIRFLEDPLNQSTKVRIEMKIEEFYKDK